MIPKQIFFIWLGDEQPDYVNYSMNVFKSMNNGFKVDLIRYTTDDIINSTDNLLQQCKKYIEYTKNGIKNKYFNFIKYRIDNKFNYIQLLSDFMRFELLYSYGGIYLDCDTFPVKPFDSKILEYNSFSQGVLALRTHENKTNNLYDDYTSYYDYNFVNNLTKYCIYQYADIYFVGAVKQYTQNDMSFDVGLKCRLLDCPWIRNFENDKVFKKYCKDFYNLKLEPYKSFIFYTYYITHFPKRCWQCDYKKSKLYCELDDYLYGK